jgi:hypothetical protein
MTIKEYLEDRIHETLEASTHEADTFNKLSEQSREIGEYSPADVEQAFLADYKLNQARTLLKVYTDNYQDAEMDEWVRVVDQSLIRSKKGLTDLIRSLVERANSDLCIEKRLNEQ